MISALNFCFNLSFVILPENWCGPPHAERIMRENLFSSFKRSLRFIVGFSLTWQMFPFLTVIFSISLTDFIMPLEIRWPMVSSFNSFGVQNIVAYWVLFMNMWRGFSSAM